MIKRMVRWLLVLLVLIWGSSACGDIDEPSDLGVVTSVAMPMGDAAGLAIHSPSMERSVIFAAQRSVQIERIRHEVNALAEEWYGVVGFSLMDMRSGTVIAFNEDTIFSAASVMKLPILLQTYISIPSPTAEEQHLMRLMILESDNDAANSLLAHSVGGEDDDSQAMLDGAAQINTRLRMLGLTNTYQYAPYDWFSYESLIPDEPMSVGEPPYTDYDPFLTTTPADMRQLLVGLDECRRGEGPLLEHFSGALTAGRCREMLDLLAQNGDPIRLRAGLPPGVRLAHKGGWIDDMEADVGILYTPQGNVVIAMFLFQPGGISEWEATQVMAKLSDLIYTIYTGESLPCPIDSE